MASRSSRYRWLTSLLLMAAAWSTPTFAQGSGDLTAATVLFDAGRKAAEAEDWSTACEKFQESQRLRPAVGTVLNIGNCAERLGRLALAWQSYTQALQGLGADDPRATYAEERLADVAARVPWLTVRVSEAARSGSTVRRDDVELHAASFGVPFPVDPGSTTLRLIAPEREDRTITVALAEGERTEIVLEPGPPLPKQAPEPPPAPRVASEPPTSPQTAPPRDTGARDDGSTGRTLGYVFGGVGVAGIIVGTIGGLLVLDRQGTVEDECDLDGARTCSKDGMDAADSGQTFSTMGTIGFIVGGVGLATGAYFLLTSDDASETALGVAPGAGGASVRVRHTF